MESKIFTFTKNQTRTTSALFVSLIFLLLCLVMFSIFLFLNEGTGIDFYLIFICALLLLIPLSALEKRWKTFNTSLETSNEQIILTNSGGNKNSLAWKKIREVKEVFNGILLLENEENTIFISSLFPNFSEIEAEILKKVQTLKIENYFEFASQKLALVVGVFSVFLINFIFAILAINVKKLASFSVFEIFLILLLLTNGVYNAYFFLKTYTKKIEITSESIFVERFYFTREIKKHEVTKVVKKFGKVELWVEGSENPLEFFLIKGGVGNLHKKLENFLGSKN
ncbi:hypothetical protein IT568_01995 [bacterium]|nr:hypothetical protein [bacterium]